MRYRHIINLLWVSLPVCVLLRVMQLNFTIDQSTGFVEQQYSQICLLITFVVCAAIAAVSFMSFALEDVKKSEKATKPLVAIASVFTGGMFFFEVVTSAADVKDFVIKELLLLILGLLSAVTFVAFGIKNIYNYNFPNGMLAIPVIYYVVKLITLFVNTSSLALVTENVFLLFANSALLWFIYEFASFENKINESQRRQKSMLAIAIAAIMLSTVAVLPRLILAILQKNDIAKGDVSSALLMLAQALFVLAYINGNYAKNNDANKRAISKHSA